MNQAKTVMHSVKLSPSMMCADMFHLAGTIRTFEEYHIPYLHIDVMDGSFVPNIMMGTEIVRQLRRFTPIPMDIHLMIDRPDDKLEWFEPQSGDIIAVHAETTAHLRQALAKIRALGAKPAAAINPATPLAVIEEALCDVDAVLVMAVNPGFAGQKMIPQTMEKIRHLRTLLDSRGLNHVEIEVDGNITEENAIKAHEAGANIFVAGTSLLFRPGRLEDHIVSFNKMFAPPNS